MSENLSIGFFAFGAVLILISILGGGFNIFNISISTTITSPLIRLTAFILGAGSILMALNPGMSILPVEATSMPLPTLTQRVEPTLISIQIQSQTAVPSLSPSPTSHAPTAIPGTATASRPDPAQLVISYWRNVSDRRYEDAWAQLSPEFQRGWHNNDYMDYVNGYQQMNLCSIVISNVSIREQDDYFSIVEAHLTYYTGTQCRSSEYDFEMQLIYDRTENSWLFDRNTIK